jgi:energy-converting hydrogenase Eha subunit B
MDEWARVISGLSPEVKSFLWFTLAGVLGALATTVLERKPLVLPQMRRGALHLGFVGTLIVSLVAAHAVDHSFGTALIGAVCGGATLKRLKTGIDKGFERLDDG